MEKLLNSSKISTFVRVRHQKTSNSLADVEKVASGASGASSASGANCASGASCASSACRHFFRNPVILRTFGVKYPVVLTEDGGNRAK